MTYGLWLSAGGLQTNEYRQTVLANNLANANTTGFKHDLAVIHERRMESATAPGGGRFRHPVMEGLTGGAWVRPTIHTFEQGSFERTGSPLDLALEGDGFLTVTDGKEVRYTRDGRLSLNGEGELVMVAGAGRWRVADEAGRPILVDPYSGGQIAIANDGTVRQGEDVVSRLGLRSFDDRTELTKEGANLYRHHGATFKTSTARVRSGFLERSTFDPIQGLASMIEVSRAYQMNANLLSLQDQTIGMAVTTVGRIG